MAQGFCLKGDDVGAEGGPEVDTGRSLKREFRALSVMICGSVSDVETCRGEGEGEAGRRREDAFAAAVYAHCGCWYSLSSSVPPGEAWAATYLLESAT